MCITELFQTTVIVCAVRLQLQQLKPLTRLHNLTISDTNPVYMQGNINVVYSDVLAKVNTSLLYTKQNW